MLKGAAHLHSVYDWYNLYRDIMSRALIESPVRLGGVGVADKLMSQNGATRENTTEDV